MNIFATLKNKINTNLKNSYGWRTNRKIIVFEVDDYGNVRVHSKKAREKMNKAGLKVASVFDQYDALENEEDLLMLYEVLDSVKDINGNPAIFTALALPANINFEKVMESGYQDYFYETLPETFAKIKGYEKVGNLWKEGIQKQLIKPQFHAREHLNVKLFVEEIRERKKELMIALQHRSFTSFGTPKYKTICPTKAFDFYEFSENKKIELILTDGLNIFENVFGFRATYMNPPGNSIHSYHFPTLKKHGIDGLLMAQVKEEHQGNAVYKKIYNYNGKKNKFNQTYLVRNCVFEPSIKMHSSWANFTFSQIENAFCWNKPAIISSHRMNFCGHIDPMNRKNSLNELKTLLNKIIRRWPHIEFMTSDQLVQTIASSKK